jgi:nucleoside-diphosphate kinase
LRCAAAKRYTLWGVSGISATQQGLPGFTLDDPCYALHQSSHFSLRNINLSHTLKGLFHMALERTLSIIKPDAVKKNVIGQIYSRFEAAGLRVIAAKMAQLSNAEAEGFYAVHRGRPFFNDLVKFMTSGPVMITALEGDSAILKHRDLMGATDPKKAAPGTIRADFAESIDANAVHGSDAAETAAVEIAYFFAGTNICA